MKYYRIVIIGNRAREIIFAKHLADEGNLVWVLSNSSSSANQYIRNVNIYFETFSLKKIEMVNPDLIYTFSDEYIFDEQLYAELMALKIKSKLMFSSPKFYYLEKDKALIRKKIISINPCITSEIKEADFQSIQSKMNNGQNYFFRIKDENEITYGKIEKSSSIIKYTGKKILYETYFDGVNITSTFYMYEGNIVVFPYVMDFPFISNNDALIKTGGAACFYASCDHIVYNHSIEEAICVGMEFTRQIVGTDYSGFIVLQFLVNKYGYYFVEYDIRPGEPELINILNAVNIRLTDYLLPLNDHKINGKAGFSLTGAFAHSEYPNYGEAFLNTEMIHNIDINKCIYWSKATVINDRITSTGTSRMGFFYVENERLGELKKEYYRFKKYIKRYCCKNIKILTDYVNFPHEIIR